MADCNLNTFIRTVPDFPESGILFRDITPLLSNVEALRCAIETMTDCCRDLNIQAVAAAEARGFIFAVPIAMELNVAFVPIRKSGKLPSDTFTYHYDLEYGKDELQIHQDAFAPGDRVLIIDDLLATGGTVNACVQLVKQTGAKVAGSLFLIELLALKGRELLAPCNVLSVIQYS